MSRPGNSPPPLPPEISRRWLQAISTAGMGRLAVAETRERGREERVFVLAALADSRPGEVVAVPIARVLLDEEVERLEPPTTLPAEVVGALFRPRGRLRAKRRRRRP